MRTGNPIANLLCNWDIALIFDVLGAFLAIHSSLSFILAHEFI